MTRIIFFGTEVLARAQLDVLAGHPEFQILEVVTQPPRAVGREQVITKSVVHIRAEELDIPVYTPEQLKTSNVHEHFLAQHPDVFVVAQYGLIIPEFLLQIAPRGAVNVHGSLLPLYRGASPVQAAIVAGETKTGVTFMLMDAKMDHGPTLTQYECSILETDTTEILMDRIATLAAQHLPQTLCDYLAGTIAPTEQNHAAATTTTLLSRESGVVHPATHDAARITRMVRAYTPWPGVSIALSETEMVKIISAEIAVEQNIQLGQLVFSKNALLVGTLQGTLAIILLKPAGKNTMTAAAFMHGHPHLNHVFVQ
jgi:methionyl-tRNA formyltransferase